jgi:hypothetical protein
VQNLWGNFNRASSGLNSGSLRMELNSRFTLSVERQSHARQRLTETTVKVHRSSHKPRSKGQRILAGGRYSLRKLYTLQKRVMAWRQQTVQQVIAGEGGMTPYMLPNSTGNK